jgi:hypothetical protein
MASTTGKLVDNRRDVVLHFVYLNEKDHNICLTYLPDCSREGMRLAEPSFQQVISLAGNSLGSF